MGRSLTLWLRCQRSDDTPRENAQACATEVTVTEVVAEGHAEDVGPVERGDEGVAAEGARGT
jgi:hypothetical protein